VTARAETIHIQRLDLSQREAFLLSTLYSIGLAYTAGDEKGARELASSLRTIVRGKNGAAALFGLANNMRLSALTIGPEDIKRMTLDP
jgi:hypothetical protein